MDKKRLYVEDKLGEECGVFGIFNNDDNDSGHMAYYGLYALQHRGQESCGIAVIDDTVVKTYKDMGLVNEVFDDDILEGLKGNIAIGHVRYSTTGGSNRINSQPIISKYAKGILAIAHNGNLSNASKLRMEMEHRGLIFQTSSDPEIIAYLIAAERVKTTSLENAVNRMMDVAKGAYSLVIMSAKKLVGCRDPLGMRPLVLGKVGNSYVLASETCALDGIGGEFIRDVEPGEIVVIDKDGVRSIKDHCGKVPSKFCIFEYVYFARPDSIVEGLSVHEARRRAGRILAKEHPVEADMVIGVPDSGLDAALGYAEESGIPYGIGLIKNRYIGRTFIAPTQGAREDAVKIKLNAMRATVEGKRIVMIDDSIVRGTTCGRIVKILKDAGAKEVHMRVCSPPFLWPCYYGTDVPSKEHLIACRLNADEICKQINADSLGYLSLEGLHKIGEGAHTTFCDACFTGNYPTATPEKEIEDVDEKEIRKSLKFEIQY